MEVTYKYRFAWSFPSPCFGRLCSRVAVTLAWLLHHFPSLKSLDCPLPSLWTILPIDIKSPARSDDVRVMLDWASVRWAFVFFISSSLLFFLLLYPCHARYPSQLLKGVSVIGAIEACATRLCLHTFSVGLILEPREGWIVTSSMLTPRQTNRPKRDLTSMCMEVTYKCCLLGLSLLLALADFAHM